jgi:hypothetical protein
MQNQPINKTKLLEEIFQDDEKFESYLNDFFLDPPRQDDVFLNSTNVDFLTKYRKDGWVESTKRAIMVLHENCYNRFGRSVRIVPRLSIEGDRTKIKLDVYKDKFAINQSETPNAQMTAFTLANLLRRLAEDHGGESWVAEYHIKEAADRLDELDISFLEERDRANGFAFRFKELQTLQKITERNNE